MSARRLIRCTRAIASWILDPAVEFGFSPADSVQTQLHFRREGALAYLAIHGRAGKAGPMDNGLEADNTVWFWHGNFPKEGLPESLTVLDWLSSRFRALRVVAQKHARWRMAFSACELV